MLALAAALLAGAGPALAIDWRPDGAWAGAAVGTTGTHMAGVGLVWDWDFRRTLRYGELTAHTEAIVNRWRYDAVGGGKDHLTQLALLPSLRLRPHGGQSRWFFELGVEGGLVDVPGFVGALRDGGYRGAVIVESDHGSNPADLAMINSWYLQRRLGVALR